MLPLSISNFLPDGINDNSVSIKVLDNLSYNKTLPESFRVLFLLVKCIYIALNQNGLFFIGSSTYMYK